MAAYVIAAGAAAMAFLGTPRRSNARKVWIAITTGMVLLAINKQLDLQSLVTDIFRTFSKMYGWYDQRRGVQAIFIVMIVACSAIGATILVINVRQSFDRYGLLLAGAFLLIAFVIIRAASFHHIDQILKVQIERVMLNWFLELSGIGLIVIASCNEIIHTRKKKNHSTPTHRMRYELQNPVS